jgi:hypothetical protein
LYLCIVKQIKTIENMEHFIILLAILLCCGTTTYGLVRVLLAIDELKNLIENRRL